MAEANGHAELGAFALGLLDPDERRTFERHLADCPHCSSELRTLEEALALVQLAAPSFELPAALERRTFVAVERAAAATALPRHGRRSRRRRVALVSAVAAAAAAALVLGLRSAPSPGELEVRTVLRAARGAAHASVDVRKTGIGRVVTFHSDTLPILPKGEYYELWFVGPGDRPGRPNRISAGTFHPDLDGRSTLALTAAVDPVLYPVLVVTAEHGDGDPRSNGREVLRSRG